jgi:hypothetical protein
MKQKKKAAISAKVEAELYKQFRKESEQVGLGLMTFISKAMYLYLVNYDFRDLLSVQPVSMATKLPYLMPNGVRLARPIVKENSDGVTTRTQQIQSPNGKISTHVDNTDEPISAAMENYFNEKINNQAIKEEENQ